MALNKDNLGAARLAAKSSFNGLTINEVVMAYGSMDGYRLAIEKADSDAIITHFKTQAILTIPGLGMAAPPPSYAVTGVSISGNIT
jgi:hypothetical protein